MFDTVFDFLNNSGVLNNSGIGSAIATQQRFIDYGQQQVSSNLQNNGGNQNGLSFGVGNSGNDPITSPGQGNSSNPSGFAAQFVPASQGTGSLGQVNFNINGQAISGFTLTFGGPISSDLQGSSGGLPSFLSAENQPFPIGPVA